MYSISRLTRNVLLALSACALIAGASVAAIAAAAGPKATRVGSAPRHPSGSTVIGSLPASTALHVTVSLKPRDPAALAAYATEVSAPGSSVYHHYLTVSEFRQRFGPSASQISSVLASLRAHGLKPGAVTANGLSIPVTATASKLAHAFSTSFQQVRVRSGRKAFANTSAPLLDSSVASVVQGVVGLNSLVLPHPLGLRAAAPQASGHATSHVATGGPQPCSTASSSAPTWSAYTSDQIASAYGFSGLYKAGDEGAGQTVAIFELEPNFSQDINAFESCYGISAPVSYKKIDGGAGTASASNGDGIETELDIENVIGMAPKASVIVYQAPNSDAALLDEYNAIVTNASVNVVSTSWGLCESESDPATISSEATLFQEAATAGKSVFAASGDSGSEDCGDSSLAVDDPASQPYVTGAGGTTLTSLGPPPTESVWSDQCSDGPCGGGGGISSVWTMPSFQSTAPAGLNVINSHSSGSPCGAPSGSDCREVPDVSANADPSTSYLIYWDGDGLATDETSCPSNALGECGWTGIGGTSGAAPLWAGLMADVNASASCTSAVGFANPALYDAAATAYSSDFNDITSGDNALSGSGQSLYPAGPGYDMASGLGTPNATPLAATLCGDIITVSNPGTQTSHVSGGSSVSLQIDATDSKGNTLTYSATGLPSGVSIDPSSGLISGSPTAGGTYNVTVTASDTPGAQGQITFPWTINTPASFTNPGAQSTVAGLPVNLQLSGPSGLTYSGSLPPGLSVNSSGLISGSPTTPGTYAVTVHATNGTYTDDEQFTWTVNPVSVSVSGPGNQVGLVGIATSLQTHASDNNGGGLTYSASGLPPGLSINGASGLISGTPTSPGGYGVTLTATDSAGGASSSTIFNWTISSATVAVANPGAQTGMVGTPTALQINAADNNGGPLSYTASGLPPGLSIDQASGRISGTPSSAGTWSVTVTAADSGSSANTTFKWVIVGLPKSAGAALSGIAAGRPRLTFTLSAGLNEAAIKKFVVNLPKGLSFTRKVGKGVILTGSGGSRLKGYKLKASGRKLTITLAQPQSQLGVAIGPPAIAAGHGLIASIKRHSAGKLTVTVTVADTSGHVAVLFSKLKPS